MGWPPGREHDGEPGDVPLSALLSQVLVAYTIELDNLAELRLQHTTTRGCPDGARAARPSERGPWLVSWPLWANVLQYVGPEGVSEAELHARSRTTRSLLGGLRRWRYVSIEEPDGARGPRPVPREVLVRTTAAGRRAQEVWRPLAVEMTDRWRDRFGPPAVDRLFDGLHTVFAALRVDPPAYLSVVYPTQGGRTEGLPPADAGPEAPPRDLSALLSGVLHAFTLDFEAASRMSLAVSANTLRVLDPEGVHVRDLPARTGVSKEANAMCTGWLQRHGCADVVPEPEAARGKVVRLTEKGRRAQGKFARVLDETEHAWVAAHGRDAVHALRAALVGFTGGDTALASSPLAPGLRPAPDNWRAHLRAPDTLPHHPMVLHRGAYPDGS